MTRSQDSTRYRRDTLENLDGLAQIAWGGPDLITEAPRGAWYYAELWESHLDENTLSVLHERTDLTIVQLSVEADAATMAWGSTGFRTGAVA